MYYYNNVQNDVNAVVLKAMKTTSAMPWEEAAPILYDAMDNIMEGELDIDDDEDESGEGTGFDMSQLQQMQQEMMQQAMQNIDMEQIQKLQQLAMENMQKMMAGLQGNNNVEDTDK